MVAEGGIRVVAVELEACEADEFRAFDRITGVSGKQGGEDVRQLFAKTHGWDRRRSRWIESNSPGCGSSSPKRIHFKKESGNIRSF